MKTAKSKPRGRPFKSGRKWNGNAGGRPRHAGLAEEIRELTNDGHIIAEKMAMILNGKSPIKGQRIRPRDLIDAAKWLAEWAFVKPPSEQRMILGADPNNPLKFEILRLKEWKDATINTNLLTRSITTPTNGS